MSGLLGGAMRGLAQSIGDFNSALQSTMVSLLGETARIAVADYIIPNWPVDTGYSRDNWRTVAIADGARILCRADYASFVYTGGERSDFTPIYAWLVPWAVQQAANRVGLPAVLQDMTEAYIGQGRTTAHITGVDRKMIQHAPKSEQQAWRTLFPELIESIEVYYRGEWQTVELVRAVGIDAGQAGTRNIIPRR